MAVAGGAAPPPPSHTAPPGAAAGGSAPPPPSHTAPFQYPSNLVSDEEFRGWQAQQYVESRALFDEQSRGPPEYIAPPRGSGMRTSPPSSGMWTPSGAGFPPGETLAGKIFFPGVTGFLRRF